MHGKPNLTFLTEAAARPEPGDAVFRERRTGKLVAAALLMAACVGGAGATWFIAAQDHFHILVALFFSQITATLFVIFLIAFHGYRASGRAGNWLLRATPQGLFLHYRSYLNHHLPAESPTVAFLPRREIAWIRSSRWKQGRRLQDETTTERRDYLEIGLRGKDLSAFEKRLAKERRVAKKAKSRHNHYPVELAGNTIRVEWRSPRTAIAPDLGKCLEFLGESYPSAENVSETLANDETVTDAMEQERRIRDYVARGDIITATRLARHYFGYDLTAARDYVAALQDESS